jgi:predicted Zn finger-like uncharacterized protein
VRISCPACEAAYDVPETILTAGRKLRCARCQWDWAPITPPPAVGPRPVSPLGPAAQGLAFSAPPPETIADIPRVRPDPMIVASHDPAPPPPARRGGAPAALVAAAWIASFAILAAAGWSLIAARQPIMHAWPASARLYAALGYVK